MSSNMRSSSYYFLYAFKQLTHYCIRELLEMMTFFVLFSVIVKKKEKNTHIDYKHALTHMHYLLTPSISICEKHTDFQGFLSHHTRTDRCIRLSIDQIQMCLENIHHFYSTEQKMREREREKSSLEHTAFLGRCRFLFGEIWLIR